MADAVELATGYLSLAVSTKGLGSQVAREFAGVERQADQSGDKAGRRFSGRFGNAIKVGIAGAVAGLGAVAAKGVSDSIKAAGDLEQSVGGVSAVFGKYASSVDKAARQSAASVGLSRNAYNELATAIGAGLKNKGIDDFAGKTQDLIGLGADLSAQFGGSAKEAVEAIGSAMRGESDPIERYGVSLNETAVNAVLAAKGQDKLKGAALDQAKAQARLTILFDQTKDAQGAFGRESDTLAGKQQRAAAQVDDLRAKIGEALLPAVSKVAGVISAKVLPAVSGFVTGMQEGTGAGGKFVGFLKSAGSALAVVGGFIARNAEVIIPLVAGVAAAVAVFKTVTAVVKAYTAVQAALNVVLSLNPVGLVIIAIGALVAAIVIAYKKSETFRKIVNGVWAGVKKAVSATVDWFRKAVPAAVTFVTTKWKALGRLLVAPVLLARQKIGDLLGKVRDRFASAVSAIGRAWDGLKEAAKAPIRFVINTVINDGLVAAFNKIARILPGVGELPNVSIPGFHAGGILPGRSSWRDGDSVPVMARPGEGWMVSEALTDPYERARLLALNKWAISGRSAKSFRERFGFATGGLVGGSGRFSDLFASRLLLAQRLANTQFRIFQRGFRPSTSYSGTSHQGDAVDLAPITSAVIRALRQVGVAAWDRTGKGNWVPHIHGVPLPGAGHAAGSAVWQAQDYLRGGDGLGGRDNGPRVGVLGKIGAFLKAGFSSFTDWFKNLVKDPLKRLGGITGSPFGRMAAGVPRMLVEGMVDRVAKFDSGGYLRPGLTLAYNGTGKNERVLTAEQSAGGVVITGGNFGYSPDEIAEAIERRRRRQMAMRAPRFATA